MTRQMRTRVATRVTVLLVLSVVAATLAITGDGPRTGWIITAAAFAFTAGCVLTAWIGDERKDHR